MTHGKDSPEQALQDVFQLMQGNAKRGGQTALAEALGISRQSVAGWTQAPAERVLEIEEAVAGQVSRYRLRPDIYPEES